MIHNNKVKFEPNRSAKDYDRKQKQPENIKIVLKNKFVMNIYDIIR